MKALSLMQPWASMVAWGEKGNETRSWVTKYRGRVAIHAAKHYPSYARAFTMTNRFVRDAIRSRFDQDSTAPIPLGAIVAVATIVEIIPTHRFLRDLPLSEKERALGDYGLGRYAWVLKDVAELAAPVPCRGALGLWTVPDDVAALIERVAA